jgi:hypothetical protein
MSENIQWEYHVGSLGSFWTGPPDEGLEQMLNEWGMDGWEVIAVTKIENSNKIRVVAKRPLTSAVRRKKTWLG